MSFRLDQMALFSAISKEISRQVPKMPAEPRLVNAVIAASNQLVVEFAKPIVKASEGMGLQAWLNSDDVGRSSEFMAYVLYTAQHSDRAWRRPIPQFAYPLDPDDFGRCLRMVRAVPEFADLIDVMMLHGEKWQAVANNWHDWANAYDDPENDGSALYAEMRRLYGEE